MNEILDAIKKRRSIRKYDPKYVVPDSDIELLLEAGMLAPSAVNMRPWEFIVVKNREKLDEITKIHRYAQMMKTADHAIVVCALAELHKGKFIDGMWAHDCGASVQNILLQAAHLNLGTCWCGIHPQEKLMDEFRALFNIPKTVVPFAVIAVGKPDEPFGSRGFYEDEKVTFVL